MNTAFLALALASVSAPGAEVVLVLDNSCSMAIGAKVLGTEESVPPNDPERAAVLGALIVEGLVRGSADRLTVIAFGSTKTDSPPVVTTADEIRSLPYSGGTFFRRPLEEARKRLEASNLDTRLFLFFTDGRPDDLLDPSEGEKLLGSGPGARFETLVLGLYGSPTARAAGEMFLQPLGRSADDVVYLSDARRVVPAFTRGLARVLGSRPESGTLEPRGRRTLEVGKYVIEVLVAVASSQPGPAFQAMVEGPAGNIPPRAAGDNGCPDRIRLLEAPKLCDPPRRHYQTFRSLNDPLNPSRWTISIPVAAGDVEYGIILRYDLAVVLRAPARARVGDPVPLEAMLTFQGRPLDDAAFFQEGGFEVYANVEGRRIRLEPTGGGVFRATWTPSVPDPMTPVRAVFRNAWMEKFAERQIAVEGFLDLELRPQPAAIELGRWRGERSTSTRCGTIDLSSSLNADRVPITCTVTGTLAEGRATCLPVAGSEAASTHGLGQPLRWEACVSMPGCCGDGEAAGSALAVRLAGAHPHYARGAVSVPVHFRVDSTGFLRCWWIELATAAGILFVLWIAAGFIRPHNFDPSSCVTIAGSEAGLRRGSALVIREQPGGVRGFYRDARLCVNSDGDILRGPSRAVVVIEAGPNGTTRFRKAAGLERRVSRTGQWEEVPAAELEHGFVQNLVYRASGLYLKFT